ncbi:threonine--tRNA ligase [Candidatus Bathyarchaeota archaeon B24-2]|nr:MAG: threonine--tRNA ligase [Candidatus Bathyarchaeota archaeon B24-2]
MKILLLHSDFIKYELVRKEIDLAEESDVKEESLKDLAVLFTCIEAGDHDETVSRAAEEVKETLNNLKVDRVLVYPYAHLSGNLAKPAEALKLIRLLAERIRALGFEVHRAPFGWNKSFSISVKGHPLAEQYMSITPAKEEGAEEKVPEALKAEEKQESKWFILDLDGRLIPVEKFDFTGHENLRKFADYEIRKSRVVDMVPPHVELMRRLEIADYEPGSDPGNLRWYPKGALIKSLLEEYVTDKVIEYGAMKVETPVMYDFEHPSLSRYLNRFPARQYIVKSDDKEFFLRFSACFGQFLMAHDAQISYRNLPLRMYELTKYSFRREKRGELVGLRRLRAFTMPDCHALCSDLEQAKEELLRRFRLSKQILTDGLELDEEDFELAIRFTRDFYEKNGDFVRRLVKEMGKPALIEEWEDRIFYFTLKWEFNFIDNLGKASALSTDQIDVENAERYGITYVDKDGEKRYPLILHCSPSGAIERGIYSILEKAYKKQMKGGVPSLPLWLSPTQVRLIPVSDEYLDYTEKLADQIEAEKIRVDIDDRELTVQRRVYEAEHEWVNYIVVVGGREKASGVLKVRDRVNRRIIELTVQELIEEVRSKVKDKPFKPLPLPRRLSARPRFFG